MASPTLPSRTWSRFSTMCSPLIAGECWMVAGRADDMYDIPVMSITEGEICRWWSGGGKRRAL